MTGLVHFDGRPSGTSRERLKVYRDVELPPQLPKGQGTTSFLDELNVSVSEFPIFRERFSYPEVML
jgi:hypothetical protein